MYVPKGDNQLHFFVIFKYKIKHFETFPSDIDMWRNLLGNPIQLRLKLLHLCEFFFTLCIESESQTA